MKKLLKLLLKPFLGKKRWQSAFEALHFFALKGMNYGGGAFLNDSGENFAISYVISKLKSNNERWIFFDVGANFGDYSQELLKQLKPITENFTIYTFEPSSTAFTKLTQNLNHEKNIKLQNFALGSQSGSAELFADAPGSGLASLVKRDVSHV